MVTIWPMLFISLRIRSLAWMPMASERLRTVIGGSIWAWLLRLGATATRWPPLWPFWPPRLRRVLVVSLSRAAAGIGRGHAAFGGPLVAAGAAAGAVGGRAERRRLALAIVFLLGDRRQRDPPVPGNGAGGVGRGARCPAGRASARSRGPASPAWGRAGWPRPAGPAGGAPGPWGPPSWPERIMASSSSRRHPLLGPLGLGLGGPPRAAAGPEGRRTGACGAATGGRGRLRAAGLFAAGPARPCASSPLRRTGPACDEPGWPRCTGWRIPAEDM